METSLMELTKVDFVVLLYTCLFCRGLSENHMGDCRSAKY